MKPFRFTIDHDPALDEVRDHMLESRLSGGIIASIMLQDDGRWVVVGKWLPPHRVNAAAKALGHNLYRRDIPPTP